MKTSNLTLKAFRHLYNKQGSYLKINRVDSSTAYLTCSLAHLKGQRHKGWASTYKMKYATCIEFFLNH